MKRPFMIPLLFVIIAFFWAFMFYGRLPDIMVTHWDGSGYADGVSSKFVGVWLMPFVMLAAYGLLLILPAIDPKSKNIEMFKSQWRNFVALLFGFLLYVYGLTLYWNLGHEFNFVRPIVIGFAILMLGVARLLKASEQNFSIGIRTPWTLSSKTVWRKTHQLGAYLFSVVAFLSLIGFVFPGVAAWLIIGSLGLVTAGLFVYSFLAFRQEHDGRKAK